MRAILLLLLLVVLSACRSGELLDISSPTAEAVAASPTPSADAPVVSDGMTIRYAWRAGSMPPPYHYEYNVQIEPDGTGEIIFYPDYPNFDGVPEWRERFTLSPTGLGVLQDEIEREGVFTTEWREMEMPPVGGSMETAEISWGEQSARFTSFVVEEQAAQAERILAVIRSAIPQDRLDSLLERQQEYQDNYGD